MSDVKQFDQWCAITHGHRMTETDKGRYVLAADYDALAARLAEAETLLRDIYDEINTGSDVWAGSKVTRRLETILGLPEVYNDLPAAADSADACQHDLQNPRHTVAVKDGTPQEAWCLVCGQQWAMPADQPPSSASMREPCACDHMSYGEYTCQSPLAGPSDTARYYCRKTGKPVGAADQPEPVK